MVVPTTTAVEGAAVESLNCATPVPVSGTDCGLPVALSLIWIDPLSAPVDVGWKTTLTVQLCPTLSVLSMAAQVFVCVNWPVAVIVLMVST